MPLSSVMCDTASGSHGHGPIPTLSFALNGSHSPDAMLHGILCKIQPSIIPWIVVLAKALQAGKVNPSLE